MLRSTVVVTVLTLVSAVGASAQSGVSETSTAQSPPGSQTVSSSAVRRTTTTFLGDTGLWFVPTAEVLASGKWSASGYRRGTNFVQGFSNIGDFAGTVAYGLGDRAEVFASFLFDTRIDRDLRPIFTAEPLVGGIVDRYPRVNTGWTGNNVGDLNIGVKVNLLSRTRVHPIALAVRGVVKAPTGDEDAGVSTGKADFLVDLVASKELREYVELAGYAGYELRGKPDNIDAPDGAFRWGVGAGFPSRSMLRGQLELIGQVPNSDTATITGVPIVATDLTVSPLVSATEKITRATAGVTWQTSKGFFVGGGLSWNMPRRNRDFYRTDDSNFGDFVDWQVRIGYHPGTHSSTYASSSSSMSMPGPGAPGANAAPTAPAAPAPETVAPPAAQTPAPAQNPPAETATPAPAPVRNYTFEDVHFDFDRYSLRPEATRALDEAVDALRQDSTLRIEIEGHTCNIGTAEYNLALGDRRANAVKNYLVSRGVTADRLRTISYGEERPRYDNAREETRRLNRRAALVVNVR